MCMNQIIILFKMSLDIKYNLQRRQRSLGAQIRTDTTGNCVLAEEWYSFGVCYHGSVEEQCCFVFIDGPTCLPALQQLEYMKNSREHNIVHSQITRKQMT